MSRGLRAPPGTPCPRRGKTPTLNRILGLSRRWRVLRLAAAAGLAAAVTLTGLPSIDTAQAAGGPPVVARPKPGTGKRCDVRNGLPPAKSTPANSGFPDDPSGLIHKSTDLPKNFDYDLPGQAYDGLKAPTAAEKQKALSKVPGDPTKNVAAWARQANSSGAPADRAMEIYARFLANKENLAFDHWFKYRYIRNQTNNSKGSGYERQLVKDYNLIGPDWLCEYYVELFDKDGDKVGERRYDAYNQRTKEFNEFKSNSRLENAQLAKDRVVAKSMSDHTFRYSGAKSFTKGQAKKISDLNEEVVADRPGKTNQVRGNQRLYNPVAKTTPVPGYSRQDRAFAPGCQSAGAQLASATTSNCGGSRGPLNERINDSGRTPAEARRIQAESRRLDSRGTLPRGGPGGVDFTTLELRYVGGLGKGKGMQYSMRADQMPDPDKNPGYGGQAKMQLASDALFTWLALTPDKFWVNLNPDQPDRVMDDKFASTDAGRVLLEADLQMKHDFFRTMDPKTDLGRRFWAALPKVDGRPCFTGIRNWIEPKPATVREQDGGIYILDAPLRLKSTEQDTITQPGGGEGVCHPTKAQRDQAQGVIDRMIVPAVEKTINTTPQYADLRRVYTSRVAAEYIRREDAKKPTDFHKFINSNDVKAWPLRAPNQNWDKDKLFQEYRKIFINGEFKYNVDTAKGVMVYIVGGVDFSKAPKRNITKVRFNVENRDLDHTTSNSLQSDDTSYRDTDTLYLGGGPVTGGGGKPTPTPTPTPTGKPSAPPSHTPGPGTSTPPAGGGGPGHPPTSPGGDLAHTGSDTPIGLISGIAAAVIVVGGALVWWMRRRRTAQD